MKRFGAIFSMPGKTGRQGELLKEEQKSRCGGRQEVVGLCYVFLLQQGCR